MSTSEWGYVVDTDATILAATDTPLGNIGARAIVNNINHLSDEFAQVRLNWSDPTGKGYATGAASAFTNIPVFSDTFPLTLRQSGDSYRLRIRIGGYYTGAGATTATLRAIVSGGMTAPGALRSWGGAGDREFLTAGLTTTSAWATGASQGTNAWTDMVYLPSALVTTTQFTTIATVGGNTAVVDVPFAQLTIYASSTAAAAHGVYVTGVYLAEYIGT